MHVVVINLASEEARWAAVCRQFRASGIQPERFEAICGEGLSVDRVARLYSPALNQRQYHQPLRPGEIGCYASHLAIWERFVQSGERCIAVFEDDVDIDPDLGAVLEALERARDDWDMVKLIGRRRERTAERMALAGGRACVGYRRVPGLTCAYVLHRRGARKLLRTRVPFGRPIDVDLRHWWECDLKIRGVLPYPVQPAASSLLSTIGGRRPPADRQTRLRKFLLQVRYSLLNWHAVHLQAATPRPAKGERRRGLADHPAP
jgi:glycosyl transferase family 25